MSLSKLKIGISLLLIGSISFILKLIIVDLEIPIQDNNLDFALRAIAYQSGDWGLSVKQHPGWPLFVSIFFHLFDSNNLMDYSVAIRLLSMIVSVVTIVPMYFLGRKFFNEKYSLVAASLFAFEPHLNYNAGFGFTEPLYILVVIVSIFFILSKNNKFILLSFLFAGFFWWIRTEGIFLFFVLTVIYFINYKSSRKLVPKYLLCVVIFALIMSPLFIQRYSQYDDPFWFYYSDHLFVDDYQKTGAYPGATASNYIEEKGIGGFLYSFILVGFYKIFEILPRILFPYLIILVPLGMLFSLRAFDQDKKSIRANWIMIIVSLLIMLIPFAAISERRFLFFLYPFLIIFGVLTAQRIVEYGLSTFSFSNKQKNTFIICSLSVIIISSGLFSLRYEINYDLEYEKLDYANYFVKQLNADVMGGPDIFYIIYVKATNPTDAFKSVEINKQKEAYANFPYTGVDRIALSGDNLHDIIVYGQNNNIKYFAVTNENEKLNFQYVPLETLTQLNDIYENEEDYPYMKKVFDSAEQNYSILKIKVFEIDYEYYNAINQ